MKSKQYMERKTLLRQAFLDTCIMSRMNASLAKSVAESVAEQTVVTESSSLMARLKDRDGHVIVSGKRTMEAAAAYKGRKTAVLNFASPFSPGGCGEKASLTQEECLCRESTLYSCISTEKCMEQFYRPHQNCYRPNRPLFFLYDSDMIYTPNVTVFKTFDQVPVLMPESEWFKVDVITMAAPNIKGQSSLKEEDMTNIFEIRFTLTVLEALRHDVEVLVLGAFGCGAFGNDPLIVATAAGRVLEKYRKNFDTVEFAIYEGGKEICYPVFDRVLNKWKEGYPID